jgi:hypothetical protein
MQWAKKTSHATVPLKLPTVHNVNNGYAIFWEPFFGGIGQKVLQEETLFPQPFPNLPLQYFLTVYGYLNLMLLKLFW